MNRQRSLRTLIACLAWSLPLGLWPLGLWTEGPVFAQSSAKPSAPSTSPLAPSLRAIVQLQGLDVPPPQTQGSALLPLQPLPNTRVYTVEMNLGNHSGRFLLDTGASTSMVSPAAVQQLQLQGTPVPQNRLGLAVAGDNCPNLKASIYKLPQLSLQGVQIQGLSALQFNSTVIPEELTGVLGMDVLKFFDLQLQPQQPSLHLRPATTLPTEWQARAVPLQEKLGVMLAQVEVNGQGPFTFLLDTGADSTFISPDVARQANLDKARSQPIQIRGFCGLEEAQTAQLTSVKLRTHQQANLDAIILSSSSILSVLGVDGILGQNFLDQYQQYWRFTPVRSAQGQFDGSLLLFPLPK
jgi:predicted aspartyl protease